MWQKEVRVWKTQWRRFNADGNSFFFLFLKSSLSLCKPGMSLIVAFSFCTCIYFVGHRWMSLFWCVCNCNNVCICANLSWNFKQHTMTSYSTITGTGWVRAMPWSVSLNLGTNCGFCWSQVNQRKDIKKEPLTTWTSCKTENTWALLHLLQTYFGERKKKKPVVDTCCLWRKELDLLGEDELSTRLLHFNTQSTRQWMSRRTWRKSSQSWGRIFLPDAVAISRDVTELGGQFTTNVEKVCCCMKQRFQVNEFSIHQASRGMEAALHGSESRSMFWVACHPPKTVAHWRRWLCMCSACSGQPIHANLRSHWWTRSRPMRGTYCHIFGGLLGNHPRTAVKPDVKTWVSEQKCHFCHSQKVNILAMGLYSWDSC